MRCPACARPVAIARPTCLYCGAPLPAEALEQTQAARQSLAAPDAPPAAALDTPDSRAVVVIEPSGADQAALGRALRLSAYEAGQRVRRGGWQLLRVGAEPDAEELTALRSCGVRVESLPLADVALAGQAQVALGGALAGERLELRTVDGPARIDPGALLLVVRGPIVRRARLDAAARPHRRSAAAEMWRHVAVHPEPGVRVHLHRRAEPRPVEIDPQAFEFGAAGAPAGVPAAALGRWIEALAAGVPVDDAFRNVTPALGPAQPEPHTAAAAIDALRRARQRNDASPAQLDNLAQFRFYSAWRATLERRLVSTTDTGGDA